MKLLFFLLFLPIALLIAFVYASVWSAVFAAFLLSIGYSLMFKKRVKVLSTSIRVLVLSVVLYSALYLGGLMGANEDIKTKIQLIEAELRAQNHNPKWVIISQKRSVFLNSKLGKSVEKSNHLIGLAIDLYIFDINGDWIYDNKDVDLLYKATLSVEEKHPHLVGGFCIYLKNKNYFTKHMIHLDLRSKHSRFFN
jgi:hypothetical protein